ncbi:molybdenum-pterin-binding protein [Ktedonobacteria bacterium brp13]|nr:molybdenum-pterin-binding protein [Ktedonobacteria bacterium brp13]
MEISARNQIKGKIKTIKMDTIMAEIAIALPDGQQLTSVITRNSAESLKLKEGDDITAIIKSTEVMLGR